MCAEALLVAHNRFRSVEPGQAREPGASGEREAPDTETQAHVRYLARKIEAILDPGVRG